MQRDRRVHGARTTIKDLNWTARNLVNMSGSRLIAPRVASRTWERLNDLVGDGHGDEGVDISTARWIIPGEKETRE